jgi:hypothetical protein
VRLVREVNEVDRLKRPVLADFGHCASDQLGSIAIKLPPASATAALTLSRNELRRSHVGITLRAATPTS